MPPLERDPQHPEATRSALLDIAQRTLTEGLLPHLAPEHRTLGLMVASAVRMAAREFEQQQTLAAGHEELRALLSESSDAGSGTALGRGHVLAIREGRFDAEPRLHALLWAEAAVRASIAKPSSLSRQERRLAGLPEAADTDPSLRPS